LQNLILYLGKKKKIEKKEVCEFMPSSEEMRVRVWQERGGAATPRSFGIKKGDLCRYFERKIQIEGVS